MLVSILKDLTKDLSVDMNKSSESLRVLIENLEKWSTALHNGVINYPKADGNFSVVNKVYNLDNILEYGIFDGISTIYLFDIQNTSVALEMMKLNLISESDFEMIKLSLNLEASIKSYSESSKKLILEIDNTMTKISSYIDGKKIVSELETDYTMRFNLLTDFRKLINYGNICLLHSDQVKLTTSKLDIILAYTI